MSEWSAALLAVVESYGPAALLVMAFLETSFITGLVVPSGAAGALAAALAREDPATLASIAGALAVGGWLGDWTGYGIGRWSGPRLQASSGWTGRTLRAHEATMGRYLGRHPLYSVTVARLVSFVRTLMPLSAGMSGVRPHTFLLFELPGLLGWVALYVGIGALAGESWERVSSLVGAGWLVVFGVAGLVLWYRNGRRKGRTGRGGAGQGPGRGGAAGGEPGPASGAGTGTEDGRP